MRLYRLLTSGVAALALARVPTGRADTRGSTRSVGATSMSKDSRVRIFSASWATWVYPKRNKAAQPLGYVRPGASVRLRSAPEPSPGRGCPKGFVEVEPHGYVCLDRHATLDGDDAYVKAMASLLPRRSGLPYRYALSNGAPMYQRLPNQAQATAAERQYGPAGSYRPQYWGNRGHELLAEQRAIAPDGPLPFFLQSGGALPGTRGERTVRRQIPHGSMLSYSSAFEHEGRTWLLSPDGTAVPADRVRPFRISAFQGVVLTDESRLPLSWIRSRARPRYIEAEGGRVRALARSWAPRTVVPLEHDLAPTVIGGRRYYRTREREHGRVVLLAEADATVVDAALRVPAGIQPGDKWLRVSISEGTLLAAVGSSPVFTTLISPGAGGVPVKGRDPVKWSTTPLGTFRITFKHRTDDMSPEQGDQRSFWLADVPHVQYFAMPFALHTAYWHEEFGEPMSAGCVNLSPVDGRWLFDWTDPPVPDEWHGATATGANGRGTVVVITR